MAALDDDYPAEFKQRMCETFLKQSPRITQKQLCIVNHIAGGPRTLRRWLRRYDGTQDSLEPEWGGGARPKLTDVQKRRFILDFVRRCNKAGEHVTWEKIHAHVCDKIRQPISMHTVKRYGHDELGISSRRTYDLVTAQGYSLPLFVFTWHRFMCKFSSLNFFVVSPVIDNTLYKREIKSFRKAAQALSPYRLVFVDGTGIRQRARPIHGLAAPDCQAYITADRPEAFQPRMDMLAAVGYAGPLAATVITAEQRREAGVRGVTKDRVKQFLREDLAPSLSGRGDYKWVISMDKGLNFKVAEVKTELKQGGVKHVQDVWLLPTGTAKFLSPLDNTLFHTVKGVFRSDKLAQSTGAPKKFRDSFMGLDRREVQACYHHCGLIDGDDVAVGLQ